VSARPRGGQRPCWPDGRDKTCTYQGRRYAWIPDKEAAVWRARDPDKGRNLVRHGSITGPCGCEGGGAATAAAEVEPSVDAGAVACIRLGRSQAAAPRNGVASW
jgi:hypothetical protein